MQTESGTGTAHTFWTLSPAAKAKIHCPSMAARARGTRSRALGTGGREDPAYGTHDTTDRIRRAFAVLVLGRARDQARQNADGFAIYEDWSTTDAIRSDRWRGRVTSSQDTGKEQKGRRAHLRLRREGSTGSNVGRAGATLDLSTTHPLDITRFALEARVKILELVGCPANASAVVSCPSAPGFLEQVQRRNTGTGWRLHGRPFRSAPLVRTSTSIDPPGALQVQLDILRCARHRLLRTRRSRTDHRPAHPRPRRG